MRIVVYGIGAIGGIVAARLAMTGADVIGIARGGMLDAIRSNGGLTLVSHEGTNLVDLPVVAGPDEIDWRPDDTILLTIKSNDTEAALVALAAAGVWRQPVICVQNGVANESIALRYFPNVYGAVVMMPGHYFTPGTVIALGTPKYGLFDIGRAPAGPAKELAPVVKPLEAAGFLCEFRDRVMEGKYGKLLLNLANIVGASLGEKARHGPWYGRVKEEGETVLAAAGIAHYDVGFDNPRRAHMRMTPIPGVETSGSSSTQSLARGTGSIETEYLNGEIVWLGRLHGIPTPVNSAFVRVARRMVQARMAPGTFPPEEFERLLAEES